MIRGDLSNRLVHLTRGCGHEDAAENFKQIFQSKKLLGSMADPELTEKVVCFSEAPLAAWTQALGSGDRIWARYSPFGVIVSKKWLYQMGGRPVIYQPNDELPQLNEANRYRHVDYDPLGGSDHTWEREWRIKTDCLDLVLDEVTFIVPTRDWEQSFINQHIADTAQLTYMIDMPISTPLEWHFIVLEDLGVEGFESFPKP